MPYIVCNESPGASGQERLESIRNLFQNTSGVETSDFYEIESAVTNGVNATCLLMRAYNDTMSLIYGENPGVEEWLKVQPLHQSMKMNNMTVDIIHERFDNIESGDYVMPDNPSTWYKFVNVLGSQSILCPGVENFGSEDVSDEEIQNAVKNFIIGNDGANIKESSFFYQRVNAGSTANNATGITDRMAMWARIIADVDNMKTKDGTNYCRQNVIDNHLVFKLDHDNDNLNVYAKYSTDELIKLADVFGLASADLEKCMLYMTMGLALNPIICWVEPKNQVKVFCPDGTSDLSQCPEPEPEVPESSSSFRMYGRLGGLMSLSLAVMVLN
jgi:hypothetical protein